jgi:hypothetical protein
MRIRRLAGAMIFASVFGLAISVLPVLAKAQVADAKPPVAEARSHLKPGLRDAGQAGWNLELAANLPPPEGFYDPKYPGGPPLLLDEAGRMRMPKLDQQRDFMNPAQMAFGTTDLAFSEGRMVVGGYHGTNIYSTEIPDKPRLIGSIVCPGGQGDAALVGDLLFVSNEEYRGRLDCGAGGVADKVSDIRFRGVRIFDISDPAHARQVAAVQTCNGSHTNTIIPDPRDPRVVYVYSQGNAQVRPAAEMAGCTDKAGDPDDAQVRIDIIKVPLDAPQTAAIVNRPPILAVKPGEIGPQRADSVAGPLTQVAPPRYCHDLNVFLDLHLAVAGCLGAGVVLDVADPAHPVRLAVLTDPNFGVYHEGVFNNEGTKVVWADEWGGGYLPRCRLGDPPNWGGDLVMDLVGGKLTPRAYYKLPAAMAGNVNCTAHNGGIMPVPGRDILVQGWFGGGASVMDFTDSAHPREIAYFNRGAVDPTLSVLAGYWTVYWRDGRLYAPDLARGLDILKFKPNPLLTANELAAAELFAGHDNQQTQSRFVWPDRPIVARAYLDQLVRDQVIAPARVAQIKRALARLEAGGKGADFAALATQLERDAEVAQGRNVERLQGIARILRKA